MIVNGFHTVRVDELIVEFMVMIWFYFYQIQEKLEEEDEGSQWDVAVIDYDASFGMKFYHQLFSYMFSAMRSTGDWKRWIVVHK